MDRFEGLGRGYDETELDHPCSRAARARIEEMHRKALVGTVEQVVTGVEALARELALDKIVVSTWNQEPAAPRRSCELLAQAGGLTRALRRRARRSGRAYERGGDQGTRDRRRTDPGRHGA